MGKAYAVWIRRFIAIRELRGHSGVGATMINTHFLNRGGRGVQSPLDKSSY
jgi:hypothetical protein